MMRLSLALFAASTALVSPVLGQDVRDTMSDAVEQVLPRDRPADRDAPPEPEAAEEAGTEAADDAAEETAPLPRPRPEAADAPVAADEAEVDADIEDDAPAEDDDASAAEIEAEGAEMEADAELPHEVVPETEVPPERIYQVACPAMLSGQVEGRLLEPISEGACGTQSPLEITAVASGGRMVPLSSPITTNCAMATALPEWVATIDGYAKAMFNSPLAEVVTGTSYMCRARVGGATNFASEHSFANAIDVVGFTLEDGTTISVQDDWLPAAQPEGRMLRLAHGAACSAFSTTLGPEANEEHEDHFHLDLGCHGAACTAQLCE